MKLRNGTGEQIAEEFAPFTWAGYDPAACVHAEPLRTVHSFKKTQKENYDVMQGERG